MWEWEGLWLTNGKASWDNHLHKPHLSLPLSGWSRFSQNHRAKVSAQHFRIRTSPRFSKVMLMKHKSSWKAHSVLIYLKTARCAKVYVQKCAKNVHTHVQRLINKPKTCGWPLNLLLDGNGWLWTVFMVNVMARKKKNKTLK